MECTYKFINRANWNIQVEGCVSHKSPAEHDKIYLIVEILITSAPLIGTLTLCYFFPFIIPIALTHSGLGLSDHDRGKLRDYWKQLKL